MSTVNCNGRLAAWSEGAASRFCSFTWMNASGLQQPSVGRTGHYNPLASHGCNAAVGYFSTLVDCDAAACQRPWRITKTSVHTYLPLESLPL